MSKHLLLRNHPPPTPKSYTLSLRLPTHKRSPLRVPNLAARTKGRLTKQTLQNMRRNIEIRSHGLRQKRRTCLLMNIDPPLRCCNFLCWRPCVKLSAKSISSDSTGQKLSHFQLRNLLPPIISCKEIEVQLLSAY